MTDHIEIELLAKEPRDAEGYVTLTAAHHAIQSAREEGRRAGMMEAAQVAWAHRERWKNAGGFHNFASAAMTIATAIEAKDKEGC